MAKWWWSNQWGHGTDDGDDRAHWAAWGWEDWSQWGNSSDAGAEEGAAAAAAAFSAAAAAEEDAVGTVGFRPAGHGRLPTRWSWRSSENGVEADKRTAPRPTEMEGHQGGRGGRGSPAPQGLAASGACSHQPPPPAQRQFDVDYFLNYTEMLGESFQQHNQALKWWRHECEDAAEPFQRSSVKVFNNMTPTWGCVCVHDPGMNFLFSEESVPWRWQEMVAMLRDEDIRKVVGGARGDGFLMGCSLELRPNSYDHFRSHALAKRLGPKKVTVKLPMWDFVLHRDDGTGVRLHPHWSDRKVDAFDLLPHADTVQPPKAGLGQSDGAGTFRHYAGLGVQRKYRFDASKEKQGSAWFGSSGASASSTAVSAWCLVARRDAMGEEAASRGSAAAGSAAASGLAAAGLS